MSEKLSVMLVGAGAMGSAMLRGWLEGGILDPTRSCVIDPTPSDHVSFIVNQHGVQINPSADTSADICVIAVKPQQFASVLPSFDWPDIDKTLFISVAAGVSLKTIRHHLAGTRAAKAPVVRAMPNLAVAAFKGVTLLYADGEVTTTQRDAASRLSSAAGSAHWLSSEDDIDAATALSGSGPAYVFLLAEALAEAGIAAGLSPELARDLADQTVIGAGALLDQENRSASQLRKAVTSPGGTTEAAMLLLDAESGLRGLMKQAVLAAKARAKELAD